MRGVQKPANVDLEISPELANVLMHDPEVKQAYLEALMSKGKAIMKKRFPTLYNTLHHQPEEGTSDE